MGRVGWFAAGLGLGLVAALHMRPASEGQCCQRVVAGVRAKIATACGPLASWCTAAGDALGIIEASPELLEALGVPIDA